jgi:hypothetical protein
MPDKVHPLENGSENQSKYDSSTRRIEIALKTRGVESDSPPLSDSEK